MKLLSRTALLTAGFSALPFAAMAQTLSEETLGRRFASEPPLLDARPEPSTGGVQDTLQSSDALRDWALRVVPGKDDRCQERAGEIHCDLTIGYVRSQLYNPDTRSEDTVELRSYIRTEEWLEAQDAALKGSQAGSTGWAPVEMDRVVAPEIRTVPGQNVRITLRNRLPKPDRAEIEGEGKQMCAHFAAPDDPNIPHCANFNRTNLHFHGGWVSPTGNGDNVFVVIEPDTSFEYKYEIPSDHPAGTFWYHSHLHGSTAAQVSSGMAGALIIEGNRWPKHDGNSWTTHGDIDVLLKDVTERTLVFQQISYGCRNAAGALADEGSAKWRPCGGETGKLEPGAVTPFDSFGPRSWENSGRYTSINGTVWPIFGDHQGDEDDEDKPIPTSAAIAGRVERWRLIHGGVRDTINLQIRKVPDISTEPAADRDRLMALARSFDTDLSPAAPSPAALIAARELEAHSLLANRAGVSQTQSRDEILDKICRPEGVTAEPVATYGIASDGLTRNKVDPRSATLLQPAYREDILVVFPTAGTYCLINDAVQTSLDPNAPPRNGRDILGFVVVGTAAEDEADFTDLEGLRGWLVERTQATISDNPNLAGKIIGALKQKPSTSEEGPFLSLAPFSPHEDVVDSEVSADGLAVVPQTVAFRIGPSTAPRPVGGILAGSGTSPVPGVRLVASSSPNLFEIGKITLGANNAPSIYNEAPYDHNRIDRLLTLGTAEEWWLTSFVAGHPFHIHVNPFQISEAWAWQPRPGCGQKMKDADGDGVPDREANGDLVLDSVEDDRDGCLIVPTDQTTWINLTVPGRPLASGPIGLDAPPPDAPTQYVGLKGVWRDTVFVEQGVLVKTRTRYERYAGDFVLHCHILDHEDEGMMQNVRIIAASDRPLDAIRGANGSVSVPRNSPAGQGHIHR